jgi:hypothetical protein
VKNIVIIVLGFEKESDFHFELRIVDGSSGFNYVCINK